MHLDCGFQADHCLLSKNGDWLIFGLIKSSALYSGPHFGLLKDMCTDVITKSGLKKKSIFELKNAVLSSHVIYQ